MEARSVVLASNGYLSNTRCYMMVSGGEVYEVDLQLSEGALESVTSPRYVQQSQKWTPAHLTLDCDDNSSLHCQVWDTNFRSIFYQDRTGTLREWRLIDGQRWEKTGFHLPNVKVGSKMAITPAADNTGALLLFFQDNLGYIRCRTIQDGCWETPDNTNGVAIAPGSPFTGIGTCIDADHNDVCVYFQDETFAIREYRKHDGVTWLTKGDLVTMRDVVTTDIVAITSTVHGRHSTRVYLQDANGAIIEGTRSSSGWNICQLARGSMTGAGILALSISTSRFHVGLVWAGIDQSLHMCGYDSVQGWNESAAYVRFQIPSSLVGKTCFDRPYSKPGIVVPQARSHMPILSPNVPRSSWPPRSPSVTQIPTPNSLGHSPSLMLRGTNSPPRPASATPLGPPSKSFPAVFSPSATLIPQTSAYGERPRSVPHGQGPQLRVPEDGHGHSTAAHAGPPLRVHIPIVVTPPAEAERGRAPRAIRKVCMHVSCRIAGFKLVYNDGQETSWCGTSGREEAFVLAQDEYITHVWYTGDGTCIQGLLFGTSNGRTSKWFGQEYGIYGLLTSDGSVLVSLFGSSQDGQLSSLKPTWELYTPYSELARYRALHRELEARWTALQSAVVALEERIGSTAESVRQLSAYEIEVARGLAELVENVEILRGQELEAGTAKVAVTPLREKYHSRHLDVCRDSVQAVVLRFNELAAALEPVMGQYDSLRQSKRREGEELLSAIRVLRDDVQTYLSKLSHQTGNIGPETKFWTAETERARSVFASDKDIFNRTLSLKRVEVVRLTEQGDASWGLQQWSGTLDLAALEDAHEHYVSSQVLKSGGRLQFCATLAAFYSRHESLLSQYHGQGEALQFHQTMSALQSLISTLGSPNTAAVAIQGAQGLAALAETSIQLLVQVQNASFSRDFARNLVDVLGAVLRAHNFDFGPINAGELLNVCSSITNQCTPTSSPSYLAVPFCSAV